MFHRCPKSRSRLSLGSILGLSLLLAAGPVLADDNILIEQANGQNAQIAATCTGGTKPSGAAKTCTLAVSTTPAASTNQKVNIDQTTPGTTNGIVVNSITAGSNIIGNVRVDQTTTGTTNGVTGVPSAAATAGVAPVVTSALASNKVLKASAGNLYSLEVSADSTLSGAAWWVMVFDATSLPGDGAVTPAKCYAMASGTTMASFAWPTPAAFATGITAGVSTNGCFTLAASVHSFISGEAK